MIRGMYPAGYGINLLRQPICVSGFEFTETSRENNVIIQPIEFKENDIKKLAIIDYGEFIDNDPESPGKRLFFVGKIYADSKGNTTYKNIFTVIMD